MKEMSIDQLELDARITNSDITLDNRVTSEEEVVKLIDKTLPGDYVSIINRNNLSEVFIYKRNDVNCPDKYCKWDGEHRDITWYDETLDEYHLYSAEQLVGLEYLVSKGITFEGKYVYLECDVDLNYHPWCPIGSPYIQSENKKYDTTGTFNGTFDGLNHVIFGLRNNMLIPRYTFAFFMSLVDATVQNIIFDHVMIESMNTDLTCAVVAVSAVNSRFSNIVINGCIKGSNVASICYYAVNTVFYSCKNDARLISDSEETSRIICGGICGELEITKTIVDDDKVNTAKIFSYCVNCGKISISGDKISSVYAGHLFGNFLCEDKNFAMIIEKCSISEDAAIKYNGNCSEIESAYYGASNDDLKESNRVTKRSKKDLLSGIIGKASVDSDIIVVNVTNSAIVKNLVIPGTVNTLQTKSGDSSFYTISAERVHSDDCVYNFEPYFSFVKSVRY